MIISQAIIDPIILVYLAYSIFMGLKHGVFKVFVGIFGTFGAFFLAWVFKHQAHALMVSMVPELSTMYATVFFLMMWLFFYGCCYLLATVLHKLVSITGLGLMVRLVGGVLNGVKAALIITLILMVLSWVNRPIFEETPLTQWFVSAGNTIMTMYKQRDVPTTSTNKILDEGSMIDDDFRYNLIER